MSIIRAVDTLVLVFSGHWGRYHAIYKIVFMLTSIPMGWGSTLKKKNHTRKEMTLFFQDKLKSAIIICLYKYRPLVSSSPYSLIAFRHNVYSISTFSSAFGPLRGGSRFPLAPLLKQCVFSNERLCFIIYLY